ncbi:hypothetical protein C8F04DRAFT_1093649 [Mycena alexandri]|uniref:Uncharacterized protein n=1 Tax=Mycena alexandri TaxID=1745969 RepID=A0AAD6T124_9AGAR|nr:hypothetical protein C8F04DRAFT_1093649 [Mycena alexandri]
MALSTKAYIKAYVIGFLATLLLLLTPTLIERYYPQAAPMATALVWLTDSIACGLSTLSVIMGSGLLISLLEDACNGIARLCGARPATGSISLEEGTTEPAPVSSVEPAFTTDTSTDTAQPSPTASEPGVGRKLLSLACFIYFLTSQFRRGNIVSLERPVLENLLTVWEYLVRGCKVVVTGFLLLTVLFAAYLWLKFTGARTAAEAPTLPVVAETAAVEVADTKEEIKEEKAKN